MKKKLLILANKRLDNILPEETISYINSFDIIVRVNGMNNICQTGGRCDFWWFNIFDKGVFLKNIGDTDYSSVKKIFNDLSTQRNATENWIRTTFNKLNKDVEIIKTECYNAKTIENINDETKLDWWSQTESDKNIPTTFIICLSYFIKHYSDEYDIYIGLCDIDNLDTLYKTNKIWSTYWHRNSGKYIERYIKDNIKEGKIKYLDIENHHKIITKTFITAKGTSVRCPRKNIKLLPYVLEQCRSYLNITVITDNLSIKRICDNYNVNCFLEPQEVQKGEFNSIYNYLVKTNQLDTIKEFIHLPLTQPIRNNETIMNVAYSDLTDYDFATTYSIVPNRKIFLLNDDFTYQYDSYERKGSLCKDSKMIDGYIYKIKTDFLIKIINSESPNHMFWNESKIKFVENTTGIFLDMDEPRDLKMFEIYKEIYK